MLLDAHVAPLVAAALPDPSTPPVPAQTRSCPSMLRPSTPLAQLAVPLAQL